MPTLARPSDLSRPAVLMARVRLLVRRLRIARWGVTLVLGASVAAWTAGVTADADRERRQWSAGAAVWVLADDVGAGELLEPGHLDAVELPAVAVPDNPVLVGRESPAGRRVRVDLHAGEVLLASRLAGAASSEVAARLPAETRGIVIAAGEFDPFVVGDRVDLLDLLSGGPLVRSALVVDTATDTMTVAVAGDLVSGVVASLATGGVVAALVP